MYPLRPNGTRVFLRKSRIPYSFAEGVTIGLRVSAVKMKGRIA